MDPEQNITRKYPVFDRADDHMYKTYVLVEDEKLVIETYGTKRRFNNHAPHNHVVISLQLDATALE